MVSVSRETGFQFVRFAFVGLANTIIDLGFYFILTRYLGFLGSLIFVAKGVSFLIATFNSFVWNRYWTFGKGFEFQWRELIKFYTVVGSGIFINLGVHYVNTIYFGVNDLFSACISAGFTAIWGFVLSKYIVFR